MRSFLSILLSSALAVGSTQPMFAADPPKPKTTTPIEHLVVIFGENISFDHYFGTYPNAANPPGEPKFVPRPDSAYVHGLTKKLLTQNPNLNSANGSGATNPFRLDRSQAQTADQNHNYGAEQASFDKGAMDLFPISTGVAGPPPDVPAGYPQVTQSTGLVMGYYDGNTVTALWNYAQQFAMNDNSYNSNFGPSTPGALNLIAGQTNGVIASTVANGPGIPSSLIPDGQGGLTMVGDPDPIDDVCSAPTRVQVEMSGKNIGDLLNDAHVTWGWFMGGFDLETTNPNGTTDCTRSTFSPVTGLAETDYVPHHQPFQYYASTRNPTHARPSSIAAIGHTDAANHQYDTHDFYDALYNSNLPAVSFVKAPSYADAHPGNSNPLDEQSFVVKVLNSLQKSPYWASTAVIIAYDDSDGWYDHQMTPIRNASYYNPEPINAQADSLTAPGACGTPGVTPQLGGPLTAQPVNGRCGPGVRTPLIIVSPWAKENFVGHKLTTQTSITRFIEDNWLGGKRIGHGSFDETAYWINDMFVDFESNPNPPNMKKLLLDPNTGMPYPGE